MSLTTTLPWATALVSHVKRRRTLVAGRCFRSLSIGLSYSKYSKRNLFTLNWEALRSPRASSRPHRRVLPVPVTAIWS